MIWHVQNENFILDSMRISMKAFHFLLFNGTFTFPECILIFCLLVLAEVSKWFYWGSLRDIQILFGIYHPCGALNATKLEQSHRAITLLESSYGSHLITNSPFSESSESGSVVVYVGSRTSSLYLWLGFVKAPIDILTHWHSNLWLFLKKFDPEGFLAEHKEWCADPQAVTNISLD